MDGNQPQRPRLRKKGRFIKQNVFMKQIKAAYHRKLQASRALKEVYDNCDCVVKGPRIIDCCTLNKYMRCYDCDQKLFFDDIVKEQVCGIASICSIRCPSCKVVKYVHTSEIYCPNDDSTKRHVLNIKLAAAMIDAGIGASQINTILTALDIPAVSKTTLKQAEDIIGKSMETVARKSCDEALLEERELTLKMPLYEESVIPETETHPPLNMHSPPDLSNPSTACVSIAASYDMGYGTRGAGRTYDSLTGHASLFGFRSKKLIGFDTKTRKCFLCERDHDPKTHDCRGVYDGTAKSMESAAAVDLMSDRNQSLNEANVKVTVFIGDGDNAGIAQVRANSSHSINKWLGKNHTVKSLNNFLFKLKAKHKFDNSVIDYLKKCFGYALSQNCADVRATTAAIRNVVKHAFGDHEKCGKWCKFSEDPTNYIHKGLPGGKNLTGEELRKDLQALFERFAANAASLALGGSTQSNESFNHTVTSKAPKSTFYGGTSSYRYRVSAAAAQTNLGTKYLAKSYQQAGISPGLNTLRYRERKDKLRLRRRMLKQTVKYKSQRNFLKNSKRRKQQNRGEGLSYMSDVAFLQTVTVPQTSHFSSPAVTQETLLVYVDIETTGLSKNSEIVQIAAKCAGGNGAAFSMHAYPLRGIHSRIREVTGLEMVGGQLLLHEKPVPATNLKTLGQHFVTFLKSTGKSIVLVGHNSFRFDFPRIYRLLCDCDLLFEFTSIVCGFTDTLQVFKADDVAKHEPSFQQSVLAEKYVSNWSAKGAHEALQDCITLEEICIALKCDNKLISSCVPTAEFIQKQICLEKKNSLEPGLQPLREVLSNMMIKRLAKNGLSLEVLKENYRLGQGESIHVLLAEDVGTGKPKVTASKKIINKLIHYLKSHENNESNEHI